MSLHNMVDGYKLAHPHMQPKNVTHVFTGWTGRSYKYMADCPNTVVWGHQARIKQYFIDWFSENFFNQDVDELEQNHTRKVSICFSPLYSDFSKFRKLHELQYLPIEVWGLPEGTLCPAGVPDHWIRNTHPEFGWLPQYLEDMWSTNNWHPSTAATVAYDRRKIMQEFVNQSCDDENITKYMISDFSLRGLTEIESAAYASSGGHLLSFAKTATVGVADFLEKYYFADIEADLSRIATPSLEHSIVCQGIASYVELLESGGEYKGVSWDKYKDDTNEYGEPIDIKLVAEMCLLKWLITDLQPEGALSYVSDTYDYWSVLTWILPKLKEDILNRNGVLIIRPDSGDPTRIVCGHSRALTWFEQDGSIKVLDKIFGSTVNRKGFKVLPPQIRLIYADAITRERNVDIPKYLIADRYSVENLYFGIGSVSYQFVTRDSRGYAIKATSATLDDGRELFLQKKPRTDSGKNSHKGCFLAYNDWTGFNKGKIKCEDGLTYEQMLSGNGRRNIYVMKFKDGKQYNLEDFATIRNRLWKGAF